MKIEQFLVKYAHSLLTLGLGMAVIFFTLNLLKTKGPSVVAGPAGTIGGIVSGSTWGF